MVDVEFTKFVEFTLQTLQNVRSCFLIGYEEQA